MESKNRISLMLKNLAHPFGIIGLVLAIIIPFLVYLAPNINQREIIRQLDLSLPFPLFCTQFIAGILLFCSLNKDFREWIKNILPNKTFSILAIICAVAISIFAATQIEARHRVQSDESVFMAVAQNMYYNHQSTTCNQGLYQNGGLKCVSTSNSFKTKGLSFLYMIGMPLFGNDLHWIFNMEFILLPLSFLLMFLAILAWTKQPLLAFFAALLMALQPTILFQFRAMSVEPLYIFLSALSLLFFKWAYDRNTSKHWILLALVLAFFAQTRQETVFCLLSFIIFALPRLLNQKDSKAPSFFLTLSIFSVPVLLTISYFQGFGFQGGEFEAHGHFFEDLAKNWKIMTTPLDTNGNLTNPFLTYFNYLFAFGVIYLVFRAIYDFRKGDKFYLEILVFLALYHIQTFMILENVSGDFSIEINQRYSLVMLPSMAFIGALPLSHAIQYFMDSVKQGSSNNAKSLLFVAIIVAVILCGWTFHYKQDFNNNVMYNRNHLTTEEHEILGWLKDQPKKDRLFIYGRPWHFVGYGISSIHYDKVRSMSNEKILKLLEQYNNEVYYIRGLDCWDSESYHKKAVEHRIATTCDVFEREMDLVGVKNILITNNYWVQIAKFNGKKSYNTQNTIVVNEPKLSDSTQKVLQLKYDLKENSDVIKDWITLITLNNKMIVNEPYQKGSYTQDIEIEKLQSGFNSIRFIVKDRKQNKVIASNTKFYFNQVDGTILLTDLKYESHKQEWGTIHYHKSIEGNALSINGEIYKNGFATHAASETVFNLDKKYASFRTSFGLDDESLCGNGVYVEILGDGKTLAKSQSFKNNVIHTLTVRTDDVQKLTLKTIPIKGIDCSHVDFVNSILIPAINNP